MDKTKRFETVLVIVLFLAVLYWFKRRDALLMAAIAVGVLSLLAPPVATGIHWCWMKLADVLGSVSSRIVLTVLYLLVLLPLALLARLFGKTAIRLTTGDGSYYKDRNHTYTKEDLMHPW